MIAASASNENIVLYSGDTQTMVHIQRDKYRVKDQVMEDYKFIDLSLFPAELRSKRLLSLYIIEESKQVKLLFALFEGGALASFRLQLKFKNAPTRIEQGYFEAVKEIDDAFFFGLMTPVFFVIVATSCI